MVARIRPAKLFASGLVLAGATLLVTSGFASLVSAAGTGPGLGTATSFAVLAGAGVTNTGPTTITGDLGTCPTPAITGFPPGVVGGTTHANDAVACGAQSDTTIAYDDAAGRAPTRTFAGPTDLGGLTLTDGVYMTPTSFAITGTLTLDGAGNPDATFIFQAGSTVITATNSTVALVNGAQACNVFWQVGSSATLGVGSEFRGTMLVLTDVTANTDASIVGRLLARNGAVTLDSNVISRPVCATASTTTGVPATTAVPPTTTATTAPTPTTAVPTPTTAAPTPTTATTATTAVPATTSTTPVMTATTVAATPTTAGTATSTTRRPTTTTPGATAASTTTVGATIAPRPPLTTALSSGANGQPLGFGQVGPAPIAGPVTTQATALTRIPALPRTGGVAPWTALTGVAAITLGLTLHRLGRRPGRAAS